jgi:hypothetical protein
MENAVGLVHLPGDRQAQHYALGATLENLDVEQLVHVGPSAWEGVRFGGIGRGSDHGVMLPASLRH